MASKKAAAAATLQETKSQAEGIGEMLHDLAEAVGDKIEESLADRPSADEVKTAVAGAAADAKMKAAEAKVKATRASRKAAKAAAQAKAKAAASPTTQTAARVGRRAARKAAASAATAAAAAKAGAAAAEAEVKARKAEEQKSGSKLRKILIFAVLAAAAAAVAKKLTSRSEPQWQATVPGRPVPAPEPTVVPEPAGAVAGMAAAQEAVDPDAADVAGGATPDEAAADALEQPRTPTSPDAPAEAVEFTEESPGNSERP
jgi:hypothetical protein